MSDEQKQPAADEIETLPERSLGAEDAEAVKGGIIVQGGLNPNIIGVKYNLAQPAPVAPIDYSAGTIKF